MLDLSKIDPETLRARGEYSTVRAAHEEAKKELAHICGKTITIIGAILRAAQPEDDSEGIEVEVLIAEAREKINDIASQTANCDSLGRQRANLKRKAWPK